MRARALTHFLRYYVAYEDGDFGWAALALDGGLKEITDKLGGRLCEVCKRGLAEGSERYCSGGCATKAAGVLAEAAASQDGMARKRPTDSSDTAMPKRKKMKKGWGKLYVVHIYAGPRM